MSPFWEGFLTGGTVAGLPLGCLIVYGLRKLSQMFDSI